MLTEDTLRELNLVEGSAVEIKAAREAAPVERPQIWYATAEEVMEAFERTLPFHENTYSYAGRRR